jgi:hypothetical protein
VGWVSERCVTVAAGFRDVSAFGYSLWVGWVGSGSVQYMTGASDLH